MIIVWTLGFCNAEMQGIQIGNETALQTAKLNEFIVLFYGFFDSFEGRFELVKLKQK